MLEDIPRRRRITPGADKGYDVPAFVEQLRQHDVTPRVAQKVRYRAIDGRTTRHLTYQVSQRLRKRVEDMREPSNGFLTPRRCYLSYLFQNKYLVGVHPARPVPPRPD